MILISDHFNDADLSWKQYLRSSDRLFQTIRMHCFSLVFIYCLSLSFDRASADESHRTDIAPPEGHFYNFYTLNEPAEDQGYQSKTIEVQGKKGDACHITVESEQFKPHARLYYGDRLIAEEAAISGQRPGDGTHYWENSFRVVLDYTGTYRIVVTSEEAGETGEFFLEYYPTVDY